MFYQKKHNVTGADKRMKFLHRLKSTKGKRMLLTGVVVSVIILLALIIELVVMSGRKDNEKTEEEKSKTTTELTKRESEDPEELLKEIGEEHYIEEELALDDSEENEKIVEQVLPEVTNVGQKNSRYPYYIMVNRQANCVTIYEQDESGEYTIPIKAMVCSVGVADATPLGTFRTSDKYSWRFLFGNVYGQYAYRINRHILFHSVPYYSKNKGDLETEEYNKLGEAASLGCVRLAVADAKWLIDNCPSGTKVTIYDSPDPGPLGKPVAQKIDLNSPHKGWDPTDPSEENPWHAVLATSTTTTTTQSTTSAPQTTTAAKPATHTTAATTATTSSEGVKILAPALITMNRRQSGNMEDAILSQITVTENKSPVDRSRIKLDVSTLTGQTYGFFTVDCQVTDTKGQITTKSLSVLLDLEEPVIGGGNKTVTVSSESELLPVIKNNIWVTDNSGETCELDITYTKTGTIEGGGIYQIQIVAQDAAGNQGVENFTYTVYGLP